MAALILISFCAFGIASCFENMFSNLELNVIFLSAQLRWIDALVIFDSAFHVIHFMLQL